MSQRAAWPHEEEQGWAFPAGKPGVPDTLLHRPRRGWEQEGAESLALRPRSSCAHTHRKDSPPPNGLGWGEGQARLLQECGPVSRRGPPRISYKSSGCRGNQLWVKTWALYPDSLCVLICIMGTTDTPLPYLYVKASSEQWPPLKPVLVTGGAGRGQEGCGSQRRKQGQSLGRGHGAPRAQTEWKPSTVQTLVLLVQFFP